MKIYFFQILILVSLTYSSSKNICFFCATEINKEPVVINNKTFHSTCAHKNPHSFSAIKNDLPRNLKICSICKKSIDGNFIYDYWGNIYHTHHKETSLNCLFCNRIISEGITKGGLRITDNKYVCSLCSVNLIDKKSNLDSILNHIKIELKSIGIDINTNKVILSMADYSKLINENVATNHHIMGKTYKKDNSHYIQILNNIPFVDFKITLAHELMHIWIDQKNLKLNIDFEESLCTYIGALMIKNKSLDYSNIYLDRLEKDGQINHFRKYKQIKSIIENTGLESFLDSIQYYNKKK